MQYIKSADFTQKNTCVTLGKFDGIHLGHRRLLQELSEWKKQNGGTSVMFTFDFHPGMFFQNKDTSLIYTEEEKKEILEKSGIDVFIAYPFTKQTSAMEAEDFIEQILVRQLDAKMVTVGEDNHFGHNRRGDVEMLQRFSKQYGFEVIPCKKVRYQGEIVSSTRVREALKKGKIELVNELLGAPYHMIGQVMRGRGLGTRLGAATVNLLPPPDKLLPPNGVYASKTWIDGRQYRSVTNVGTRPTIDPTDSRIWAETHLLEQGIELYDEKICVELFSFLREEQCFADLDALQQQIQKDIEKTKEIFRLCMHAQESIKK